MDTSTITNSTLALGLALAAITTGCGGGGGGGSRGASAAAIDSQRPAPLEPKVTYGALITPRLGHQATYLGEGLVLVTGGETLTLAATDTAELIDTRSGRRRALAGRMTTARVGHVATALGDGRVVIAGGRDAAGAPLTSVEVWDERTQAFAAHPTALATPHLFGAAAVAAREELVVFGGQGEATLETFSLPDLTPLRVLPADPTGRVTGQSSPFSAAFLDAEERTHSYSPGDAAVDVSPPFSPFPDTPETNQARDHVVEAGGLLGERPSDRLLVAFPEGALTLAVPRSELTVTSLSSVEGGAEVSLSLISGGRGADGRPSGAFEIVHLTPLDGDGALLGSNISQADLDALLATLAQTRAERDRFVAETQRVQGQIADVVSRTATQRAANDRAADALAQSEAQRRAAEADVARLDAQRTTLLAEAARLEAQTQRDAAAIAATTAQLTSTQQDLAAAQAALAAAQRAEAARRADLDRLTAELASLRTLEADLRRQRAAAIPTPAPRPTITSNPNSLPGVPSPQPSGPSITLTGPRSINVAVKPQEFVIPFTWSASPDTQLVRFEVISDAGTFPTWTALTNYRRLGGTFGWKPGGVVRNEVFRMRAVATDAQGRTGTSNVVAVGPF